MIAVKILAAFSFIISATAPICAAQEVEQECSETARMAISGALRVIGDSNYLTNRELLRQLGCRNIPRIKQQICAELVQKASNIGTQGIPGYRNIRDLMKDMGC